MKPTLKHQVFTNYAMESESEEVDQRIITVEEADENDNYDEDFEEVSDGGSPLKNINSSMIRSP